MQITNKMVKDLLDVLEDLRKELSPIEPEKYPYAEWEKGRGRVRERLRRLPEYVETAVRPIKLEPKTGRPKEVDLVQRTMLFLFARVMDKSNRDVEELLELFAPLFGVKVNYKYIERLYSDEEIKMVLHNLLILLLQSENVSGDLSGDGTGYSLAITSHYRTAPKKEGKLYRYVFRLIDLKSGMYVGLGYSNKSEMEAFHKAMAMVKNLGIAVDSISLDRYYSSRKVIRVFDSRTTLYLIPKSNLTKIGMDWSRIIRKIIANPRTFLKRYFKRNLSESGFSADKRRFGWLIRQRREDRREMATFAIGVLHNVFTVRVSR